MAFDPGINLNETLGTMIGTRHICQCCGRIATIIDEYHDGDENGYIYKFDGVPEHRWISTNAASIRFHRIGGDANDVLRSLFASQ